MTERWQGAFATANHAGSACAIMLVAAMAAMAAKPASQRVRFPDGVILWILIVAASVGLVTSQSRTATAAAFAGWIAAGRPGGKFATALATLAALAVAAWLLLTRGASVLPGTHDVSTVHHARVWIDSCVLALSNPINGCGWGDFGRVWQSWMEPVGWKFGFTSALSTPLTILAETGFVYGLPIIAASVLPIFFSSAAPAVSAAKSAWVTLLFAGASCSLQRDQLVVVIAIAVVSWLVWAVAANRRPENGRRFIMSIAASFICAGAICSAVAAAGWIFSCYQVIVGPSRDVSVELIPHNRIGTIVVVRGLGSGPLAGNSVLQDLVTNGWAIVAMDQLPHPDAVVTSVESARTLGPVMLVASGSGAQIVLPIRNVDVVLVDPWFGASDMPRSDQLKLIRSADYRNAHDLASAITGNTTTRQGSPGMAGVGSGRNR